MAEFLPWADGLVVLPLNLTLCGSDMLRHAGLSSHDTQFLAGSPQESAWVVSRCEAETTLANEASDSLSCRCQEPWLYFPKYSVSASQNIFALICDGPLVFPSRTNDRWIMSSMLWTLIIVVPKVTTSHSAWPIKCVNCDCGFDDSFNLEFLCEMFSRAQPRKFSPSKISSLYKSQSSKQKFL